MSAEQITPPQSPDEDALREIATRSADDLATVLSVASEEARPALIQTVADALEPAGAMVVDMHDVLKLSALSSFSDESLEGKAGARTGQTRAQILAGIALKSTLHPHGRRNRRKT